MHRHPGHRSHQISASCSFPHSDTVHGHPQSKYAGSLTFQCKPSCSLVPQQTSISLRSGVCLFASGNHRWYTAEDVSKRAKYVDTHTELVCRTPESRYSHFQQHPPLGRACALYLTFFCFNLIVSSFTKIPLPLYGSGTRHLRISAANWFSSSRLIPSSRIRVGCGAEAFMPFGTPRSTGCEKPRRKQTKSWSGYSSSSGRLSMVARYPIPTRRRTAVWPSDTPMM